MSNNGHISRVFSYFLHFKNMHTYRMTMVNVIIQVRETKFLWNINGNKMKMTAMMATMMLMMKWNVMCANNNKRYKGMYWIYTLHVLWIFSRTFFQCFVRMSLSCHRKHWNCSFFSPSLSLLLSFCYFAWYCHCYCHFHCAAYIYDKIEWPMVCDEHWMDGIVVVTNDVQQKIFAFHLKSHFFALQLHSSHFVLARMFLMHRMKLCVKITM